MKLILLVILFVHLCGFGLGAHGQAMFRGNPAHTGVYSGPAPRQFHRVKWKFPTGNRIVASPVIEGRTIFFGSDDGNVYAVDSETGRQIWKPKTRRRRSPTTQYSLAAGTVTFTPLMRRAAKRNGVSTAAKMRSFTIRLAFNRLRRLWTASFTPVAGTRSSTLWMRPAGRKSGDLITSLAG